jgi:hypothetical protein
VAGGGYLNFLSLKQRIASSKQPTAATAGGYLGEFWMLNLNVELNSEKLSGCRSKRVVGGMLRTAATAAGYLGNAAKSSSRKVLVQTFFQKIYRSTGACRGAGTS